MEGKGRSPGRFDFAAQKGIEIDRVFGVPRNGEGIEKIAYTREWTEA
jgi:hypothetical protein